MSVSFNNVSSGQEMLLSDVGSFAIEILKDYIANEDLLHDFKARLEESHNWREDVAGILNVSSLSEEEIVEIILVLADHSPAFVMENIRSYGIVDEPSMIRIAQVCATKLLHGFSYRIKEFNIQNKEALDDLYNIYVEAFVQSNARLLIKTIFRIREVTEPSLIKMMERIAAFRPDLVLEYLDESGIQNCQARHALILQCTSQISGKTGELIKIWMMENQQLLFSIPEFLPNNMPRIVQVPPSRDMQKVFDLFKTFALNPKEELIGRVLWRRCSNKLEYKSLIKNMHVDSRMARCSHTVRALFSSMFGPTDILLKQITFSTPPLAHEFDHLWNLFKQNGISLGSAHPSHFFAYTFASAALDHTFVVIQYRDEKKQIKYQILQSWVSDHSLSEYMEKRGNGLTSDEFQQFLVRFQFLLQEEYWTLEAEIFYNQYFMFRESCPIGKPHLREDQRLEIKWGMSCFTAMESYKAQFDLFKNSSGIK